MTPLEVKTFGREQELYDGMTDARLNMRMRLLTQSIFLENSKLFVNFT